MSALPTNTPSNSKKDPVPRVFHDLKVSQLETALAEYQEFFELLVRLLDKHGINARDFHDDL